MTQFMQKLLPLFALLLVMVSCKQEQTTEEVSLNDSTIGIQTYQLDHIKGETIIDGHSLGYEITETAEEINVNLKIDEHTLEAQVHLQPTSIHYDGHDAVLTQKQKDVLATFADKFSYALVTSNENTTENFEISMMENVLFRIADYWAVAPTNFIYGQKAMRSIEISSNRSTGNDGITCINRNSSYFLQYTNQFNQVISATRVAGYNGGGTYGCMGRCGANCGRWWIPSAWTLDCFEHDECSLNYSASGGGSDPNCGDEFDEAMDDYVFGVLWGCNG